MGVQKHTGTDETLTCTQNNGQPCTAEQVQAVAEVANSLEVQYQLQLIEIEYWEFEITRRDSGKEVSSGARSQETPEKRSRDGRTGDASEGISSHKKTDHVSAGINRKQRDGKPPRPALAPQ